ncbi:MAG TPA: hypothetical protein VKB35_11955, partial [Ktedonobacteraceae bacterium]|nr:hypothetical protein [Ktedonobacteraceae bacterium]
ELGRLVDASRPREMPVEALDLGAGYELAAAAIRGLTRRLTTDKGEVPQQQPNLRLLDGETVDGPWEDRVYSTGRGPARRLRFPLAIERNPLFWEHPADIPGASNPVWVTLPASSVRGERRTALPTPSG